MKYFIISIVLLGLPLTAEAQRGQRAPTIDPRMSRTDADTGGRMNPADSILYHARTTASRKPYGECAGHAFQTCASGETVARLSIDGTAYGVLIQVYDDRFGMERTAFLWRITGRAGVGGTDEGGRQRRGGGGGGGGGRSRRGG